MAIVKDYYEALGFGKNQDPAKINQGQIDKNFKALSWEKNPDKVVEKFTEGTSTGPFGKKIPSAVAASVKNMSNYLGLDPSTAKPSDFESLLKDVRDKAKEERDELQEMYDTLKNPQRKEAYLRELQQSRDEAAKKQQQEASAAQQQQAQQAETAQQQTQQQTAVKVADQQQVVQINSTQKEGATSKQLIDYIRPEKGKTVEDIVKSFNEFKDHNELTDKDASHKKLEDGSTAFYFTDKTAADNFVKHLEGQGIAARVAPPQAAASPQAQQPAQQPAQQQPTQEPPTAPGLK